MNLSDVWDWPFFWTVFRGFVATAAPFVMIIVAVGVMGLLIYYIVRTVQAKRG